MPYVKYMFRIFNLLAIFFVLLPVAVSAQTVSSAKCPTISVRLANGSSHSQVIALKKFLVAEGVMGPNEYTKYFGPLTQAALQKWQCKKGIVCSGTPSSTGYGTTGPLTRAALKNCLPVFGTTPIGVSAPVSPSVPTVQPVLPQSTSTVSGGGPPTGGTNCKLPNPTTEVREKSCTAGQSGSITENRTASCPAGATQSIWGEWRVVSNTCVSAEFSMSLDAGSYLSGAPLTLTYHNAPVSNTFDMIGIYSANNTLAWWTYLNGHQRLTTAQSLLPSSKDAAITLDMLPLSAGSYSIRFIKAATTDLLSSQSVTFSIIDRAPAQQVSVYLGPRHEAWPAVTRMANGNLLLVFHSGESHSTSNQNGYAMSTESSDGGKTWSVPRVMFDDLAYDDTPGSDLVTLSDGTLLMAVHQATPQGVSPAVARTIVIRSKDNGATWQQSNPIDPYSFPYGRMIEKGNGDVLMPVYGFYAGGGGLFVSHDKGLTWNYSGVSVAPKAAVYSTDPGVVNWTEASVLPITETTWLAVVRANTYGPNYADNKLYKVISNDGGTTWGTPEYLFDGASPELFRLGSGNIVLCLSDRDLAGDNQTGVRCHRSSDEGKTFTSGAMVYTQANHDSSDLGYPYIVSLPDNSYFMAYYKSASAADSSVDIGGYVFSEQALQK